MPGDRLSLTVRVSCQIHFVCLFHQLAQVGQNVSLSTDRDIFGFEIMFHIDTQLTLGQIPHMAIGCGHLVIRPKKFFYCLNLCR